MIMCAGAEGATAPETLRQTDSRLMALWKAIVRGLNRVGPPKGSGRERIACACRLYLSGPVTEGA